jgi:hypothetical protein
LTDLEKQAKEPFCEKASPKTVREWLEDKRQELNFDPDIDQSNDRKYWGYFALSELLKDPFVEFAEKLQKRIADAQEIAKNMPLEKDYRNVGTYEADLKRWHTTLAKSLAGDEKQK